MATGGERDSRGGGGGGLPFRNLNSTEAMHGVSLFEINITRRWTRRRTQTKAPLCFDDDIWLRKNLHPNSQTKAPYTCAAIKNMLAKRWPDGTLSRSGCEQMERHRNKQHPNGLSWVCGCSCPQPQLTKAKCEDFNPWLQAHSGGYTCAKIRALKFCNQLVSQTPLSWNLESWKLSCAVSDQRSWLACRSGQQPPFDGLGVWLFVLWFSASQRRCRSYA